MKNEEQGSVISGQGSEVAVAPDLGRSSCTESNRTKSVPHGQVPRRRGLTPSVTDTPESLPPCLEIMKRVMERSREEDDGSLTFTIEEMEFLAGDPLFARLDPAMAAEIRKILEAGPPD